MILHWYSDKEKTICVLNLQKSNFGGKFYINIGIFIKPDIKIEAQFARERLKKRYEYMK
jgi:Domain of unknown function (DUF4304)